MALLITAYDRCEGKEPVGEMKAEHNYARAPKFKSTGDTLEMAFDVRTTDGIFQRTSSHGTVEIDGLMFWRMMAALAKNPEVVRYMSEAVDTIRLSGQFTGTDGKQHPAPAFKKRVLGHEGRYVDVSAEDWITHRAEYREKYGIKVEGTL